MDNTRIRLEIPSKFSLETIAYKPTHITNIELLSLSIKAKESFAEYKDIPLTEIFEQFEKLTSGNSQP